MLKQCYVILETAFFIALGYYVAIWGIGPALI